jgi:predicted Zn-dependent peptidase
VADDELQRVVRTGLYRLHFSRDNVEELASRYGWGEISNDMHTLSDDAKEWQQVNPAMIQQAARQCLTPQRMFFVCVGPWRQGDRDVVEALLQSVSGDTDGLV